MKWQFLDEDYQRSYNPKSNLREFGNPYCQNEGWMCHCYKARTVCHSPLDLQSPRGGTPSIHSRRFNKNKPSYIQYVETVPVPKGYPHLCVHIYIYTEMHESIYIYNYKHICHIHTYSYLYIRLCVYIYIHTVFVFLSIANITILVS